MSGGVDSSVAACLLKEQGHDVVGVFMRLGTPDAGSADDGPEASGDVYLPSPGTDAHPQGADDNGNRHRGCCSVLDATDARRVAGDLDIPFYVLNFEKDFIRLMDYFADEYAAARTPNPCVLCNQWLKFGKLVDYADAIGADLIATGHYARVDNVSGRPRLRRARYLTKDQSYVLFPIAPATLARTLFPLGDMTKEQVRAHAQRLGLSLYDKPESQDICFVPDGDYARVVRSRRPDAFRPGEIRHVDGRVLGRHEGLPHFTVGQRRGLRVAVGSPLYVASLDGDSSTVTVGPRDAVLSPAATAERVTWLCEPPERSFRAEVRIRYHHTPAPAEVHVLPNGRVQAQFDQPQLAVTPGQAMVLYHGDEVLGGGWITGRHD